MNEYLFHALLGLIYLAMDAELTYATMLPPPKLSAGNRTHNLLTLSLYFFWPLALFGLLLILAIWFSIAYRPPTLW
jgi:hypothetical protein